MLAKLSATIPEGEGWLYAPKWAGRASRFYANSLEPCLAIGNILSRPPARGTNGVRAWLSARHLDVLGLIADGLANKEIATALGITPATVKGYVEDILLALGVPNRAAACALWAAELVRREPERPDAPPGAPPAE